MRMDILGNDSLQNGKSLDKDKDEQQILNGEALYPSAKVKLPSTN